MKKAKVHSSSGDAFQRRVTKTVSVMVTVFTLSIAPMQLMLLYASATPEVRYEALRTFDMNAYRLYISCYYVAAAVLMYNSFWNFFIYQRFDDTFKKGFEKLLGLICKKDAASAGLARDGSSDAATNQEVIELGTIG